SPWSASAGAWSGRFSIGTSLRSGSTGASVRSRWMDGAPSGSPATRWRASPDHPEKGSHFFSERVDGREHCLGVSVHLDAIPPLHDLPVRPDGVGRAAESHLASAVIGFLLSHA